MLKVAITGNIASGKTTVCKIIKDMGFPVINTDDIAHKILEKPSVIQALSKYHVLNNSGQIDRTKLGKLAFTNPTVKKDLENITHPKIFAEVEKFFHHHQNSRLTFVEVPLLFETNAEDKFNIIILVYANDDIRLTRLINRNGYSKTEARTRLASQQSQDSKIPKSTHIIYANDDDPSNLNDQINAILATYQ